MIKMADADQEQLYLCMLKLLKKGSNDDFEILQELCKEISGDLRDLKYTIDESAKEQLNTLVENGREDLAGFIPVKTTGDGSCLFRALSFLYFGHENRHRELRVRCVIEMALNRSRYLGDKDLLERSKAESNYIEKISGKSENGNTSNASESASDTEDHSTAESDFTKSVLHTCNPDEFATFWHIQALGVILERKIQIISSSTRKSSYEMKELIKLKKHFDRTLDPRDLGGKLDPDEQERPPLRIMWLLDNEHFVPLIRSAKLKKERDSGLGESLNESNECTRTETDVKESDFKPNENLASTPKKDLKASHSKNVKKEYTDGSYDEKVDIIKINNVDDATKNLGKLFWNNYVRNKLRKNTSIKLDLLSLTGPYQMADPEILGISSAKNTVKFVAKLIEVQFQIKWNTEDGKPEEFNFYEFCDVEKHRAHLKYDPRKAHVFTQLYRMKEDHEKMKEVKGKDKQDFCPDVYVRGENGWVRISFARQRCVAVNFEDEFSWMHESLRKFVAGAEKIDLPSTELEEINFKPVKAIIKKPTLYWAVLDDTDFRRGDHLKLHKIGKTQVYVGRALNGIENRWIKGRKSHSEMMKKCADHICNMTSFDVSSLEGIQLVDARLLLAKMRPEEENEAVFLIKTFETNVPLEKGEKRHREGKKIVSGKQNLHIVPYKNIGDTWTPKRMEFGMNYA